MDDADATGRSGPTHPAPGRDGLIEPTEREMLRAATVLGTFVRRWGLPLNPEDIDEIAYAVLRHAHTDHDDLNDIVVAVEQQVDQHETRAQQLQDAMQRHLGRAQHGHACG